MEKKMKEIVEKIKAAKTPEEAMAIVKEMPKVELSAEEIDKVAGGTGRIELTEAQADKVVGGGHYIKLPGNEKLWIDLHDNGYVLGTNKWCDIAYVIEEMAMTGGFTLDVLCDFALVAFGVQSRDVTEGMRISGPSYVADGLNNAHGYHFTGGY